MHTPTKEERCSKDVFDLSIYSSHQCYRRWTVEEDGSKWCKQHAPSSQKARDKASGAHYEAQHQEYMAPYNEANRLRAINAQLLGALEFCLSVLEANPVEMSERMAIDKARATIAAAKETG